MDLVEVKSKMLVLRNQAVLLDRDVAVIYNVQTKEVNQAVRNNPDKFPNGFVFRLNADEFIDWKSKILTSNLSPEVLQTLKDGNPEQAAKLTQAGHKLAALIGDNLSTESTKTTIELNFAVLKITHEVTRAKTRK